MKRIVWILAHWTEEGQFICYDDARTVQAKYKLSNSSQSSGILRCNRNSFIDIAPCHSCALFFKWSMWVYVFMYFTRWFIQVYGLFLIHGIFWTLAYSLTIGTRINCKEGANSGMKSGEWTFCEWHRKISGILCRLQKCVQMWMKCKCLRHEYVKNNVRILTHSCENTILGSISIPLHLSARTYREYL